MMMLHVRKVVARSASQPGALSCVLNLNVDPNHSFGATVRWQSSTNSSFHESNKIFSAWERKIGAASAGLPEFIERWNRSKFYGVGAAGILGSLALLATDGICLHTGVWAVIVGGYWGIGLLDIAQPHHTIRKNFPVLGHIRYLLESVRPEIRQYFIESDQDSKPFSREQRSMVYQRAKGMVDTQAFGTRRDVYLEGYEAISHSMYPKTVKEEAKRVLIGGRDCKQKYSASRLNISAMSYGALSENAILALNGAAQMGDFYHNTGEGGISRFHLKPGGDIVWNVGTGYFGCRCPHTAKFDPERFKERASHPNVKMIEIKLSQGAKPGHGGMLPGAKVTPEIAEARGIKIGETCHSPPSHSAFSDARGLMAFVVQLRELSDGKPIGFKLCMGRPVEIAAVIGAMVEMDVYPDFITIDGSEGGTGAAPPEFSNHVGWPLTDALNFINNTLVGAGVRDHVKLIASGRVLSGFSMVKNLALGADINNSARAMLFALGCIQALKCNTGMCPTGITSSHEYLIQGLDVNNKTHRVFNYHKKTVSNFHELIGAIGLDDPSKLRPNHVIRRMAGGTYSKSYHDIFPPLESGSLLTGDAGSHPTNVQAVWDAGQKILRGNLSMKSIPFRT